ncbi:hypothetical protein CXB51_024192 [Gossypium anomalum]|uniref:RNase H type-1 domain-containing protein n=1 Tax=Gossypium anomalum TaxID=47600 RepID=A0A8J5YFW8_9ROSI|nr:hypothetical protein CXB51_024192 [Gossypium anomalum]
MDYFDQGFSGRVFKDSDVNWLYGYSIMVGKDSIFRVEARAVLEGLHIAWERTFRQIDMECDNALLVETILASGAASSRMMELRLIHMLLTQNWKVHTHHSSKERPDIIPLELLVIWFLRASCYSSSERPDRL